VSSGGRIEAVEVLRLTLPLSRPFHTSRGIDHERRLCVVRVVTTEAEGWGECAALNEPGYTHEWADGAAERLERELAPLLLAGKPWRDLADPMATATLEDALLDAELRADGTSLAEHLGAVTDRVPSGIALGLDTTVDDVVAAAADGYHRVKLKVAPGHDVDFVRAVRAACPDLALQVDANGGYALADAEHLAALDDLDLLLIEQPFGVDDLDGHAALARRMRTPVCLDESITSLAAAEEALSRGACSVVCVKAGRLGGLLEAVRVHDACHAASVPAWVGGMLESGLGRAANIALAALPGFTLPGDLSPSARWFADDLTQPFTLDADGYLRVPTGPGLGVTPEPVGLARYTTSTTTVRP
jgi:O-succinylbenzoate synthase